MTDPMHISPALLARVRESWGEQFAGFGPIGEPWREPLVTLGNLRIDVVRQRFWQYSTRCALVFVVGDRELVYRANDPVDAHARVIDRVVARDVASGEDVDLSLHVVATFGHPLQLALLDLLAVFGVGASHAQLAAIHGNDGHTATSVTRWNLQGTAGGWYEETCSLRLVVDDSRWRFERTVIATDGEDGMALS